MWWIGISVVFLALLHNAWAPLLYGADKTVETSENAGAAIVSTYFGGSGDDGFLGSQLAVDNQGYIYVVGYSSSTDLPVPPGACQPNNNGDYDFFVAKFTYDMSILMAATYLGGTGLERYPSITINQLNQVVIVGYSGSDDFPTSPGSYEPDYFGGESDIIVSILDSDLTTLLHSTYMGGNSTEGPYNRPGILVLSNGNIYVAGTTVSSDFPTSPTGYDRLYSGGKEFVVFQFNNDLSELIASTYIGGSGDEEFPSLATDTDGNIFISGATNASDYPTTPGAYSRELGGGYWTGTITKLNDDLSDVLASTMVGDAGALDLVCDQPGFLYITGHTDDVDYPITASAYDQTHNGVNEGFLAKFDNDLENLIACTFFSGNTSGICIGGALALDGTGNISCVSFTSSAILPTTPDAFDDSYNGGEDVYYLVLSESLASLQYSSYLGGTGEDAAISTTYDQNGNIYMAGMSASSDFWTYPTCYDTSYNGGAYDCFITGFINSTPTCGDANSDASINIGDVVYIGNHVFRSSECAANPPIGCPPDPYEAGDVNCDESVNIGDAVYLGNVIFRPGSPAPCAACP